MPISSGRTWSFCVSAGGDKGLTCQYFGGGEGSARFGGGPGLSRPMMWAAGMPLPCLGVLGGEVRLLPSKMAEDTDDGDGVVAVEDERMDRLDGLPHLV